MSIWHGIYAAAFHAAAVTPGGWQDSYNNVLSNTSGVWNGYNIRLLLPKTTLPTTGKQLRLTVKSHPLSATVVRNMVVGFRAASGDAYDFAAAPKTVTFGGVTLKALAAGVTAVSDPIDFPVDASTDLVIAFRGDGTFPTSAGVQPIVGYYKTGADETTALDVTGYTSTSYSVSVSRVEWSADTYVPPSPPVSGSHSYWRALWTGGASANVVIIGELAFKDVGGTVLSTGNVPVSAAFSSGNNPERAYDGSTTTFWQSANLPLADGGNWLGYAFAAPVNVNSLAITTTTSNPSERPLEGALQWSDDGITWTTKFTFSLDGWTSGISETQEVDGTPKTAHKYWRGSWRTYAGNIRIDELKMYSTVGGTDLTTGGTAIGSAQSSGSLANAFDKTDNTVWASQSGGVYGMETGAIWLGYNFATPVTVTAVDVKVPATSFDQGPMTGMLQYSDNGTIWKDAFFMQFDPWVASAVQSVNVNSAYNPRLTKLGKMVIVQQVAPMLSKISKIIIVKAL